MTKPKHSFIKGRFKGALIAFKGAYTFIRTEPSGQVQFVLALLLIALGFYVGLDREDWILQILAIGMVLTAEALNTAIEKLSDFVHSDYHERIGFIKDVSSGGVWFSAMSALAIELFIYLPKI
jgi:diacylglycerol kinase (ATP)